MRHERPADAHNIAYEIQADYLDGPGCDCPLCRPHGGLVAFMSRDDLTLTGEERSAPAHRFSRQRLNHTFCSTPGAQDRPAHMPDLGSYGLRIAKSKTA